MYWKGLSSEVAGSFTTYSWLVYRTVPEKLPETTISRLVLSPVARGLRSSLHTQGLPVLGKQPRARAFRYRAAHPSVSTTVPGSVVAEAGSLWEFSQAQRKQSGMRTKEKSQGRDSAGLSKARSEELACGSCTGKRGCSGNAK